ncbi:MAG: transglycosylase SLT domain-containing protein [Rhodanobacter sp.]
MLARHERIVDWAALTPAPAHWNRPFAPPRTSPAPRQRSAEFARLLTAWRGRCAAGAAAWRHFVAGRIAVARQSSLPLHRYLATACLLAAVLAIVLHGRGQPQRRPAMAAAVASSGHAVAAAAVPPSVDPAPPARHEAPVPAAPIATDGRVPATPSAELLLSEASTMDLMMPIAEPDLDITSRHSLWAQVGKTYGLDPLLLYSVALVESKSLDPDGKVAPTPWLFRVNDHLVRGDRHHVQLQMAAASQFGSAVQDVGIMQVYYPMHRDAVRDPLTLLDPRTNITVAAKILREGMRQTPDRVLGVGYYHSHTPTLARGYGTAVLTVYRRLKQIRRAPGKREALAR